MPGKENALPRTPLAVSVTVISDHNATAALASMLGGHYNAELIQATGSSKLEPGDVYDAEIATDLAVGRALVKLGRRLRRRGLAKVADATEKKTKKRVSAQMQRLGRHVQHPERFGKKADRRAAALRGARLSARAGTGTSRDNGLPTIEPASRPD